MLLQPLLPPLVDQRPRWIRMCTWWMALQWANSRWSPQTGRLVSALVARSLTCCLSILWCVRISWHMVR